MNRLHTLILFLTFLPMQTTLSQVYLEGYIGGMFGRSIISCLTTHNTYNILGLTANFNATAKKLSPAVTGGFKVGWWPNYCQDNPCMNDCTPWCEHFGFYVDARFHELEYKHHICSTKLCYSNGFAQASGRSDICLFSKGPSATLALLLACRYGFCATDRFPFGRLQPYVAAGPAGLFTRQKIELQVSPHEVDGNHLTIILKNTYTIAPAKKRWVHAPCCALDAGMRFLATTDCFLDFFFNYRFSPICISNRCAPQLSLKTHYHLFSVGAGLGYEF